MGKSTDCNQYTCYLIFTYFPERYQMVTMLIPAGKDTDTHKDGAICQTPWTTEQRFRCRPVVTTMTTANPNNYSLPLLNVKETNTKVVSPYISSTFSFFHCTIKGKKIHVKLIPLKVLKSSLWHIMWSDAPHNLCVCSHINPKFVWTCGSRQRSLLISDSQIHSKGTL